MLAILTKKQDKHTYLYKMSKKEKISEKIV